MDWQILIDVFRFLALSQIILLIILLVKVPKKKLYIWLTITFNICVAAYLLGYWKPINDMPYLFGLILPFSIALPLSFWLFSKALFDDFFKWKPIYTNWVLGTIAVHTLFFLLNGKVWIDLEGDWKVIAYLPPYLLSFLFVFLGIMEALKNYNTDLVAQRLRFRYPFVVISAIVMFITLASLMALQHDKLPLLLELIQKIIITVLAFYFSTNQLKLNSIFFEEKPSANVPATDKKMDTQLLSKLKIQFEKENIYLQEGLTIRQLAKMMNVKEYKLRQVINQQLGFRNFNEYLNVYRIKDACVMLSDATKKDLTVTEIAYKIGYTSLSPFNKAFKDITGSTPTKYRKENLP